MISRADVEKIALLARLKLDPEQTQAMTRQLGRILEYVEQLRELETDDIEPLAHPLEIVNAIAEDQPEPPLPREDALANAPNHDGECYRVPAVL